MPKYFCSECNKILIRNAADMRITERKSYCESTGRHAILTRLRKRRKKDKDLAL